MKIDENGPSGESNPEPSEKQREALRLIEQRPDATQGDLAEEFDVTRATVSRWLNDIPGFEWGRREKLASEILNGSEMPKTSEPTEPESTASESELTESGSTEEVSRRLGAIELRLDKLEDGEGTEFASVDPELAHKVVHACMNSERISEAEELQVLKELMG